MGLAFVGVAATRRPAGCFDSTSLSGHHASDDVVEFSDGKVTWHSCCGSLPAGRFFQLPGGPWIWVYTKEYTSRQKATNDTYVAEFIVRPSLLGLRVVSKTNAGETYMLKRRLSRPKETTLGNTGTNRQGE